MELKKDIQDIFYTHLDEIKNSNLPSHVKRTAEDIANCRTNAMHGHVFECPDKHFAAILRNSCNNRNCPKCQAYHRFHWMNQTKKMVLNSSHYHIVLKLPAFCYPHFLKNYKSFVNILFNSGRKTIQKIIKYSQFNNSTPGIIMALHTYGEDNQLHPHLHIMMTAGGIAETKLKWLTYDRNLFDLNSFSAYYTSILRKQLIRYAKDKPELHRDFITQCKSLQKQDLFLSEKYSNPEHIIKYLAKTIRGTSIQNHHITDISNGNIAYSVKSGSTSTLTEHEFVRRYLNHVLPWNQKSIRYAGLYSSASRELLSFAKTIIPEPEYSNVQTETDDTDLQLKQQNEFIIPHKLCPLCKKKMVQTEKIFPFKVPQFIFAKFGKDPPIEDLFVKRAA